MIALAPMPRCSTAARPADWTRDPGRAKHSGWVDLAYRGAFYTLAATPVWGAVVTLVAVWRHTHP